MIEYTPMDTKEALSLLQTKGIFNVRGLIGYKHEDEVRGQNLAVLDCGSTFRLWGFTIVREGESYILRFSGGSFRHPTLENALGDLLSFERDINRRPPLAPSEPAGFVGYNNTSVTYG